MPPLLGDDSMGEDIRPSDAVDDYPLPILPILNAAVQPAGITTAGGPDDTNEQMMQPEQVQKVHERDTELAGLDRPAPDYQADEHATDKSKVSPHDLPAKGDIFHVGVDDNNRPSEDDDSEAVCVKGRKSANRTRQTQSRSNQKINHRSKPSAKCTREHSESESGSDGCDSPPTKKTSHDRGRYLRTFQPQPRPISKGIVPITDDIDVVKTIAYQGKPGIVMLNGVIAWTKCQKDLNEMVQSHLIQARPKYTQLNFEDAYNREAAFAQQVLTSDLSLSSQTQNLLQLV
ncbi:hypothetical protein GMDG_08261 [Pseudogymnoascus destructans 20631-21]|uniref:Uncharacterized protein n=1 Tax=Pseudogymnoascus destructans (strain ATCC MYA-4855 / 20631-21) TaxID=658429 RepID=L8G2S5_PSED2|nr:hypothetical protein GMDG_08261 [Pseudogymnoascus destructans 20631-21]